MKTNNPTEFEKERPVIKKTEFGDHMVVSCAWCWPDLPDFYAKYPLTQNIPISHGICKNHFKAFIVDHNGNPANN